MWLVVKFVHCRAVLYIPIATRYSYEYGKEWYRHGNKWTVSHPHGKV